MNGIVSGEVNCYPYTGNEGWINYADYRYESFFHDVGSGIFLDPAYLYDLK